MTQGEIRKVDKDNGKLTIRHESIAHMSMPAMTMVFLVKDKSLLDTVKPGDKIRFVVIQDAGKMIVTEIQPSP
jgi:Cu/Ag efflux protein CusF